MRTVVQVHNHYQQSGGEDVVVAAERALLETHAHRVVCLTADNTAIRSKYPLTVAVRTVWSQRSYRSLRGLIRATRPDVVHVHNTLPLLSPSVYYAARAEGIPVVQTLHNYRLLCPVATLYRDGRVCETCVGRGIPWPGLVHGCYRGSRAATGPVVGMLAAHRALGTWTRMVTVYIALTEFARQKFIDGGLPSEKIVVKPNFVYPDPGPGEGSAKSALYVGRLTPEKGIDTLLKAWGCLSPLVRLKVVGDGPLAPVVAEAATRLKGVEYLGRKSRDEVLALMKEATVLVFPSESYEGFPMTIAEAYATGLPVIASDLGAMASLVRHERTGLLFRPGDPDDLAAKVDWVLSHPHELLRMRQEARGEYEAKYTAEQNYRMLMGIYDRAIELARRG